MTGDLGKLDLDSAGSPPRRAGAGRCVGCQGQDAMAGVEAAMALSYPN
jgi:hypothetical protein